MSRLFGMYCRPQAVNADIPEANVFYKQMNTLVFYDNQLTGIEQIHFI